VNVKAGCRPLCQTSVLNAGSWPEPIKASGMRKRRIHRPDKGLYKKRNAIERFFNKLKYCRKIATRYDKLMSTFLAMLKLATIRIWLRHKESTA
jgi:transposase